MSREIVEVLNLTNPGVEPVTGDTVQISYSDGTKTDRPFQSVEQTIPEEPIRVITVGAFLRRMDESANDLAVLYGMIDAGRNNGNYVLFSAMENLKRLEYVNLNDPALRPTLGAIGIYTEAELDNIFRDGIQDEEPETV